MNEEQLCLRALQLAQAAVDHGNHPFGALLATAAGDIVIECENTVNTGKDPSAHAEMNVVRQLGSKKLLGPELQTMTLYTSTEPCMMCCGALYWSGVAKVVYVSSEKALAKHAGDDFLCPCRETFAKGKRQVEVKGPVMEEEGEKLHAAYWPMLFASSASS